MTRPASTPPRAVSSTPTISGPERLGVGRGEVPSASISHESGERLGEAWGRRC